MKEEEENERKLKSSQESTTIVETKLRGCSFSEDLKNVECFENF